MELSALEKFTTGPSTTSGGSAKRRKRREDFEQYSVGSWLVGYAASVAQWSCHSSSLLLTKEHQCGSGSVHTSSVGC